MADVNKDNANVTDNQQNLDNQNVQDNANSNDNGGSGSEPEVTLESLMAKIATLEVENKKNKAALDKALKEKGDITKQYREVLTEAQQAKIDKENADEEQKQYVADLEKFKKTAEAKARYALQGMSEEMAVKAAEAEINGDMDALATIQKQHTETLIKQKEAEWQKSRPPVNAGTGEDGKEDDPFLKGFASVKTIYGK